MKEALTQANTLLVPGLAALTVNHCEGDMEVVEAVREEWCQYLTHPGLTEGNSLPSFFSLLASVQMYVVIMSVLLYYLFLNEDTFLFFYQDTL